MPNSKNRLLNRLKHLDYDRYVLRLSEELIENEEQRAKFNEITTLLDEWIEELKEQIKDG